tara:strand:+ start:8505 stop:10376 length:1872 start_codon:yes stop_codon:yes gene_type:complete
MKNDLKNSSSPYLKQYADQNIAWFEWGDLPFELARQRNKPIFLSIGFSSCHWCHVMSRESFQDSEIANVLNDQFICIKVDREQRPDIDQLYMKALVGMTGHGGWPMSLFLTPNGIPFFAGTYFPKYPGEDHLSFIELIGRISILWHKNQDDIVSMTSQVLEKLKDAYSVSDQPTYVNSHIKDQIDFKEGGLLGAPKFPQIKLWQAIFAQGILTKETDLVDVSFLTASNLCFGGIYDHLGGGLFRYSTDEHWLIPHFEKLLCDNALFIALLVDLYNYEQHDFLSSRLDQTVEWISNTLSEKGAFASSTDADSDGQEGLFYVWDTPELKQLLKEDYTIAKQYFNWNDEPQQILSTKHIQEETFEPAVINRIFYALESAQKKKVAPTVDRKIMLDWNALLIASLAKASLVLNKSEWLDMAIKCDLTCQSILFKEGQWFHCSYQQHVTKSCYIDDIANYIQAKLQLYLATSEAHFLTEAKELIKEAERFYDEDNQLYRQNPIEDNTLIVNPWSWDDHAVPSGNGMMAFNMIMLCLIDGDHEYRERWDALRQTYEKVVSDKRTCGQMISALALSQHGLLIKADWSKRPHDLKCSPTWLMQYSTNQKVICCDFNGCLNQVHGFDDLRSI